MPYDVVLKIMKKPSVLDPEAKAVKNILGKLGFEVEDVRMGKTLSYETSAKTEEIAREEATRICEEYLYENGYLTNNNVFEIDIRRK
ncbi:MAG TPA: phosphoribosylformylglycinamidine synthase subunit PurS [Candidatus Nanoarchaeia archaeon]|nr:phosphoribosylformylglycinamidine synthase subunit PurS [Candidatus Nanoarchaeia archaeon]